MVKDSALRQQLIDLLTKGQAHATLDQALKDFPKSRAGERAMGLPHSCWELLEHIRIAQEDILRFSRSAEYEEMKWPDDYWPKSAGPASEAEWDASVKAIGADLGAFLELVKDPKRDLHEAFAWGQGQTLLREALLIADHNAYHVGQLVLVRRALGAW